MVRTRHEWWIWMQEEGGENVSLAGPEARRQRPSVFPTVHCLCWTPIHHLIHLHFPSTDLIPPPPAPSCVCMLLPTLQCFIRVHAIEWYCLVRRIVFSECQRDVGAAFGVVLTRVNFEDDSGRRVRIYIEGTFLIETWIFYSISFVLFGVLGALNISFSVLTRSSSSSSSQGILWSWQYCRSPCALEKFNGFGYVLEMYMEKRSMDEWEISLKFWIFPSPYIPPPSSMWKARNMRHFRMNNEWQSEAFDRECVVFLLCGLSCMKYIQTLFFLESRSFSSIRKFGWRIKEEIIKIVWMLRTSKIRIVSLFLCSIEANKKILHPFPCPLCVRNSDIYWSQFLRRNCSQKVRYFHPLTQASTTKQRSFLPTFRVVDRKTPTFPRFSHIQPLLPFNFNLAPLSHNVYMCISIQHIIIHISLDRERRKKSSPHWCKFQRY